MKEFNRTSIANIFGQGACHDQGKAPCPDRGKYLARKTTIHKA